MAMAAGREAADEEGDAKQAEQGAFDPGFHDRVSFFREVVEQGLNGAGHGAPRPLCAVSVCFGLCQGGPGRHMGFTWACP
jgi:hypothetical protein